MIFAILAGYTLVATGGLAIGALYGRRAGAAAAAVTHSIHARLTALEHSSRSTSRCERTACGGHGSPRLRNRETRQRDRETRGCRG